MESWICFEVEESWAARNGRKGEVVERFGFKVRFLFLAILLLSIPCVHAKWSEPILLLELNDLQNQYQAVEPAISSDGLSIYFVRRVPGGTTPMYIFEARRTDRAGVFQTPKRLVELGNNGNYVEKPWISLDGKRIYFAEIMKYQGLWHRFIRFSSRVSVDQLWSPATSIMDIHKFYNESVDSLPTLIGDELTIFWHSNLSTNLTSRKIYSAVRKSLQDPFTSIREVPELNAIGAGLSYITPDGLAMYFSAPNPKNGAPNIWKGTRAARDGVFGDFAIISDLCDEVRPAVSPCMTSDGRTFIFSAKRGTDLTKNWGVWESHWVEDPLVEARQNLQQSLTAKQAMFGPLDAAVERERRTLDTLMFLWTNGGYQGLTQDDLYQAYGQTSLAISRQLLARRYLDQSVAALQKALDWLKPKAAPVP
jgi:hypothetical protein